MHPEKIHPSSLCRLSVLNLTDSNLCKSLQRWQLVNATASVRKGEVPMLSTVLARVQALNSGPNVQPFYAHQLDKAWLQTL